MAKSVGTRRIGHRSLLAFIVGAALLVFGGLNSAQAAVPPAQGHPKAHKYCTIVLQKIKPSQAKAKVARQACADRPDDPSVAVPSGGTPLVELYSDVNLVGWTETIVGWSGPCDSAGYALDDLRYANVVVEGISSYQVFNNCQFSSIYYDINRQNYCNLFSGDAEYVGDKCNDHVYSMHLWGP